MPDLPARIVVVGGGLAGLAAAWTLAGRGQRVTLLESRPRLGGRASSIVDRETGELIDNCQHVSLGCCTRFREFCAGLGLADLFVRQRALHFVGPPAGPVESAGPAATTGSTTAAARTTARRPPIVRFAAAPLPAPLHLAPALLRMPWFTVRDVLRLARGLKTLRADPVTTDEPFLDWLIRHGQPEPLRRRFWHLVLVSALSESLDRISLRHARKVFVDSFLRDRTGWEVWIPRVPLGELYETRLLAGLRNRGVDVRTGSGVRRLIESGPAGPGSVRRITAVELRDGRTLEASAVVLAVPHWLVRPLLPDSLRADPALAGIEQLETAPIASVHLWFDRPVTNLPHAVFVDRLSQWLFNRTRLQTGRDLDATGRSAVQVVISAARDLSSLDEPEIIARVVAELREVWPESSAAVLLRGRVITEHRAVFAPLPGVDELRPAQATPVPNLALAGDWTSTGWPSTMESAVRSGILAARALLAGRVEVDRSASAG